MEQYKNGLSPTTWVGRFHEACSSNDLTEAKSLVEEIRGSKTLSVKREIDQPDIDLYTPLHRACEKGCVDIVRYLLELGADPDVSHPDGWTPLHVAAWKNQVEVVRFLLDDQRVDPLALDWYGNKAIGLTTSDEVKKLISEHGNQKNESEGKVDNWQDQKLRAACQMVPSKKQAEMIEFSQKHCQEHGHGGEWDK